MFLDGFAEPGSPIIALGALLDHSYFAQLSHCEFVFVFNESDPERYRCLEAESRDAPGQSFAVAFEREGPGPVGSCGDLAALLTQHFADRLDYTPLITLFVDERHDHRLRGSSSPAKKTVAVE